MQHLANARLDDKYLLESGRIYLEGGHCSACWPKLKGVRGTLLDPFGHTAERRTERALIVHYERVLEEIAANLDERNLDVAIALASLPATIRGYGHVKRANLDAARLREASLLAAFRSPAREAVPLAA